MVFGVSIILFNELNKKSAAKKKMRSTHACTPTFATFFAIFTSVVVYSRTKNKKRTTYTKRFDCSTSLCTVCSFVKVILCDYHFHLHSCAIKKKKCGAHTHVHQLSRLSSQYSRRLLSILAQKKYNPPPSQKVTYLCHF